MPSIERSLASITEDRRTDYLWPTKDLARALAIHPNKAGEWWSRTEQKLIDVGVAMPGETAAMLAMLMAKILAERARRGKD